MASLNESSSFKRRKFTLQYKLSVIQWHSLRDSSVRDTSRRLGIHRSIISRWLEDKDKLINERSTLNQLNLSLLSWYRDQPLTVNNKRLRDKASQIAHELKLGTFRASDKWAKKWRKRLLWRDSNSTDTPTNVPHIGSFLSHTTGQEYITLSPNDSSNDHSNNNKDSNKDDTYYYNDYRTPEHNYCTSTTLNDCWLGGESNDTFPVSSNDLLSSFDDHCSFYHISGRYTPFLPCNNGPSLNEGVLAIGHRLSQPVFTLAPQIIS